MAGPARGIRQSARSAPSGFPTWLAQPAALVEGSRLIDAPPAGITLAEILPLAKDYELVVMHTSTPSFKRAGRRRGAGDEGHAIPISRSA